MAVALFTTYFYAWNEKRAHDGDTVVPPVDCVKSELQQNVNDESFRLPQNYKSEQVLPRMFLKHFKQNPTSIKISDIEHWENRDNDCFSMDELLSIVEQTCSTSSTERYWATFNI